MWPLGPGGGAAEGWKHGGRAVECVVAIFEDSTYYGIDKDKYDVLSTLGNNKNKHE